MRWFVLEMLYAASEQNGMGEQEGMYHVGRLTGSLSKISVGLIR